MFSLRQYIYVGWVPVSLHKDIAINDKEIQIFVSLYSSLRQMMSDILKQWLKVSPWITGNWHKPTFMFSRHLLVSWLTFNFR